MRGVGFEPTKALSQQILSLPPFPLGHPRVHIPEAKPHVLNFGTSFSALTSALSTSLAASTGV